MFQCCSFQLCFTTLRAHTALQSIRKNTVLSSMWDEVGNSSGIFSSDDLFLQMRAVLCAFIQGTKPCLMTQLLLLQTALNDIRYCFFFFFTSRKVPKINHVLDIYHDNAMHFLYLHHGNTILFVFYFANVMCFGYDTMYF